MKKTLLTTAVIGLCSQSLLTVAAQEAPSSNDSAASEISTTVENTQDEATDVSTEESIDGTTNSENDGESSEIATEPTEVNKLQFELPNAEVVDEFLTELKELPFAHKIKTDAPTVTEGESNTVSLVLELIEIPNEEEMTAVNDLYKTHTSHEKLNFIAPFKFSSEAEADAYGKQVKEKGVNDGHNLVHVEYKVDSSQGESGVEYTVSFELNGGQVKNGLQPQFGQDRMIHLYDENESVVGEEPTEGNAIYKEATEPEQPGEQPGDQPGENVVDYIVNYTEETIPFETERIEDPSLLVGTERVAREGTNGIKGIKTTQKTVNGQPEGEPKVEETITEPVNRIISVGTGQPEDNKEVVEQAIPFEVEKRENPELKAGEEKVVQEGVEGIKVITTITPMFRGEKVGESKVSEEVKKQPVNKIIEVGTKTEDERVDTREEAIKFETEERQVDTRKAGERVVVRRGQDGVKQIKTTQKYVNGKPSGDPKVEETVLRQPVNEIVEVGTKTEEDRVDTREETIKFKTEERKTDTRKAGERVVVRKGQDGVKRIKTTQKYVNGKPSGDPKVEETVLRQPINEIVEVGTAQQTITNNQNPTTPNATPNTTQNGVTTSPTGQPVNNNATPGTVTTTSQYVTIARKHTVQAGETLQTVAQKYNTTPENIKAWNNLTSDYVYQGQVLTVSEAMRVPVEEYIAVQGDTAQAIADRFGMSVGDLQKLNNNDPLSYIVQGQVVKVIDLKKGFGNDANSASLTENFNVDQKTQQAPLANKNYEQPRKEEQVVAIPETGESRTLGIIGLMTLAFGSVLAFFGKKKRDEKKSA